MIKKMLMKLRVWFVVNRLRIRLDINRFEIWMENLLPIVCDGCGKSIYMREARQVTTLWGTSVQICDECYGREFNPFGGK